MDQRAESEVLTIEGISAADTWEADYARILERAEKRLESRVENGVRPHREPDRQDGWPLTPFDGIVETGRAA
jgi:hypothetical protein